MKCFSKNPSTDINHLKKILLNEIPKDYYLIYNYKNSDENCWPNSKVSRNFSLIKKENYNKNSFGIIIEEACKINRNDLLRKSLNILKNLNYLQFNVMKNEDNKKNFCKLNEKIVDELKEYINNKEENNNLKRIIHFPYDTNIDDAKLTCDILSITPYVDSDFEFSTVDNYLLKYNNVFRPGFFPYPGLLHPDNEFQLVFYLVIKSPLFMDFDRYLGETYKDFDEFIKKHKFLIDFHQNQKTFPLKLQTSFNTKRYSSSRQLKIYSKPNESDEKQTFWKIRIANKKKNHFRLAYFKGLKGQQNLIYCLEAKHQKLKLSSCDDKS